MNDISHIFKIAPWQTIEIFKELAEILKQDFPVSNEAASIAQFTSDYEQIIRDLWEQFKLDPTKQNAKDFIEAVELSGEPIWEAAMLDLMDAQTLSAEQEQLLREQWGNHTDYLENSLLPDIIRGIQEGQRDFSNMDYRVIFMYAGALWSFGFLATIMYDGTTLRDLGDVFIFLGPNDEATCTGPRGCAQFANKLFTVAEILAQNIIPGQLRCLTNCRHMLLPVASPLSDEQTKHLPGQHSQQTHAPKSSNPPKLSDEAWMDLIAPTLGAKGLTEWSEQHLKSSQTFVSIRNGYNYDDKETGLKSRIMGIEEHPNNDGRIRVWGFVFDKDNQRKGQYFRTLSPDGTVRHNAFELDNDVQANGFGKRFYKQMETSYIKGGVKRIELEANATVGGYAWARQGFDWNDGKPPTKLMADFTSKHQAKYGTPAPNISKPWDIAAYAGPDGDRFGKSIMLGSKWEAVKDLNPDSEGFKVGNIHYKV